MLKIVQSQDIERLFRQMLGFFDANPIGVFEPRQILVPSHGVGLWLKLQLANHHGIAAQVETSFLGGFQWELYGRLAEQDQSLELGQTTPKAPLSTALMRWQIFNYIWQIYQQRFQASSAEHVDHAAIAALDFLLRKIVIAQHHTGSQQQIDSNDQEVKAKIWTLSEQIAQVFAGYATYRPEWLLAWGRGEQLSLRASLHHPMDDQPEWLRQRYAEMQIWQAWLWKTLFAETFVQREAEISGFWARLAAEPLLTRKLPSNITIFTVIQLPPAALLFVRQLAQYVDVLLLHYNPSQEYWADLVDSRWLQRRQSERADDALGRDTHPLLTRMGKQARDVFKLLVQLSGGEFTPLLREVWADDFSQPLEIDADQPPLLQQIKQHALDLSNVTDWPFDPQDQSLAIHACHSTMRQLEVLREEIIQWLGAGTAADRRLPADILVLLPDLAEAAPLIGAVFAKVSSKQSGEITVPYEITGLAPPDVDALWQALVGRFHLLAGRLPCEALLDWLALPPIQASYGLSPEQVTRMGELLVDAGFRRGFDGAHLSRTLAATDADVRFTLRFALDRLILGMAMPVATLYAGCLPVTTLLRDDFELVAILQQIYEVLDRHRAELQAQRPVVEWLALLKQTLQENFPTERDSRGWSSIQLAINEMEKNAKAAERDAAEDVEPVRLPLRFILDELGGSLDEAVQSSTPTGKVTFARLGTLRPLPYRVIAVLNLDTGKFPKREQKNTFDLIGAFPAKLGDRSRAEDDLGAFLDALLLASDACWLFYNGQDVQDDQPRLPAAPVQELMDFLRAHLALLDDADAHGVEEAASPLDRYIHRRHSLLPFERDNFAPPQPRSGAGVWFEVAARLGGAAKLPAPWLSPSQLEQRAIPNSVLSAEQWIKDLLQPARYFLAESRIGRLYLEEGLTQLEPLTLNKLDEYQLRNEFQSAKQKQGQLTRHQWVAALPVGSAGDAYWRKGEREQQQIAARLAQFGGEITALTERVLRLADSDLFDGVATWQLSIRVPTDAKVSLWLAQSASSGKGKHRLRFWLEHLLWQVQRQTTVADVEAERGVRVCVYSKETLQAMPISAADAAQYLLDWLHLWQRAAKSPLVLPPALALEAFAKPDKNNPEFRLKDDLDELVKKWLGEGFNRFTTPQQNEDCALHSDWQLILQGLDPEQAFLAALEMEATRLYPPLLAHTEVVKATGEAA